MENKNVIWKSWDLLSEEEQKKYLEDEEMLNCYLDNTNEDIEDFNREAFEEYVRECYEAYFDDDFGRIGNWKYSALGNRLVKGQGGLGLWDGPHTIQPRTFANLYEAIQQCLEDSNEIYETENGDLCISAHHHDGVNNFVIKLANDKPLHFRKTVFSVGA